MLAAPFRTARVRQHSMMLTADFKPRHLSAICYLLSAICYWLLAIGYWLLAIGYWLLAIGYWRG